MGHASVALKKRRKSIVKERATREGVFELMLWLKKVVYGDNQQLTRRVISEVSGTLIQKTDFYNWTRLNRVPNSATLRLAILTLSRIALRQVLEDIDRRRMVESLSDLVLANFKSSKLQRSASERYFKEWLESKFTQVGVSDQTGTDITDFYHHVFWCLLNGINPVRPISPFSSDFCVAAEAAISGDPARLRAAVPHGKTSKGGLAEQEWKSLEWLGINAERICECFRDQKIALLRCVVQAVSEGQHAAVSVACLPPDFPLEVAGTKGVDFEGAALNGVDFEGANLEMANFKKADLADVNFKGANLAGANFEGANLAGANFEGANLQDVKLGGANLENANFKSVNFVTCKKDQETAPKDRTGTLVS